MGKYKKKEKKSAEKIRGENANRKECRKDEKGNYQKKEAGKDKGTTTHKK